MVFRINELLSASIVRVNGSQWKSTKIQMFRKLFRILNINKNHEINENQCNCLGISKHQQSHPSTFREGVRTGASKSSVLSEFKPESTTIRVKLTSDQARCKQAHRRVHLSQSASPKVPRSDLNSLPTRLGANRLIEEFNSQRVKPAKLWPGSWLNHFV